MARENQLRARNRRLVESMAFVGLLMGLGGSPNWVSAQSAGEPQKSVTEPEPRQNHEPTKPPGQTPARVEGRTASEWAADLSSTDPNVRARAATALVKLGEPATGAVLLALSDADRTDPQRRGEIATLLAKLGPGAEQAGLEWVSESRDGVGLIRLRMAGRAAFAHPRTPWVSAVLAAALADSDQTLRTIAVDEVRRMLFHAAVQGLPPGAETLIPAIAERLADPDPAVRRTAAEALGDFGPTVSGEVVEKLAGLLSDRNDDLRAAVATTLARMGTVAKPAVPALAQALSDANSVVRGRAALALIRAEPTRLQEVLTALRGKSPEDAVAAGVALEQLPDLALPDAKLVELLVSAVEESDEPVRLAALSALTRRTFAGSAEHAELRATVARAAVGRLTDRQPRVRIAAALTLVRVDASRASRAVDTLLGLLADPDKSVQLAAVEALGQLGSAAQSALEPLAKLAEDPDLADAAAAARRRITGQPDPE